MKVHQGLSLRRLLTVVALAALVAGIPSCKTERIAIMKDIPDTSRIVRFVPMQNAAAPVIKSDDILNIVIQVLDEKANAILNQGNQSIVSGAVNGGTSGATQTSVAGYLVSKTGNIHMPYIGDVHVSGLTTEQVRDTVAKKILYYFKDPVVNVRFANFKVTVLGEVRIPSTFLVPNEKPTVIDAIGLAGDITIYGRRDNVMLIRDADGKKEITRLNLDSSSVIASPYFTLRPNDVLYVEATPSRVQSTDAYRNRNITIISAALSLLTIITARLLFK